MAKRDYAAKMALEEEEQDDDYDDDDDSKERVFWIEAVFIVIQQRNVNQFAHFQNRDCIPRIASIPTR